MDVIVDAVCALPDRAMVGVDGVDGAGKTTFADELGRAVEARGRAVIRATIDTFHRPKAQRYALGPCSAEGFYLDSHDLDAVREMLLDPWRAGEPFRRRAFDVDADRPVEAPLEHAPDGAVLVFDGIFAQRPELRGYWDLSIWVDGWERVRRERSVWEPSDVWTLLRWCRIVGRYEAGQRLYVESCRPEACADFVVETNVSLPEHMIVSSWTTRRVRPPTLWRRSWRSSG